MEVWLIVLLFCIVTTINVFFLINAYITKSIELVFIPVFVYYLLYSATHNWLLVNFSIVVTLSVFLGLLIELVFEKIIKMQIEKTLRKKND